MQVPRSNQRQANRCWFPRWGVPATAFDLDNLPPVTVFWSIPIYNAEGYFVANEIDRYTINSFMLEAGELSVKDNRLVVYIQKEKPSDPEQAKNWLPAPPEGFRFAARFYGPLFRRDHC